MSTLEVNNLKEVGGTSFTMEGIPKWWVHYNQDTPAVTDSMNTDSVTDVAAGDHDVTITNNMANATYVITCMNSETADAVAYTADLDAQSAGSCSLFSRRAGNNTATDLSDNMYVGAGDLA